MLVVFYSYSFDSLGPTTQLPKAPRKVVVSLGSRGLVEQSICVWTCTWREHACVGQRISLGVGPYLPPRLRQVLFSVG